MPNFLQRLFRADPLNNPAIPLSSPMAWAEFQGAPSAAGERVNHFTAMQHAAVYACVKVLQSAFLSLPCKVYESTGKGKLPAIDNDLYDLLARRPNPEMSAPTFWGAVMACRVLHGNAYAIIQRDPTRKHATPVALWPIPPSYVQVLRTDNVLSYRVTVNGKSTIYDSRDMLHFRGFTLDGCVGLDPITGARQTIGTGIAASKHIGGYFGRGSRPSGVLTRSQQTAVVGTIAGKTAPENSDSVRNSWERANAGDNQGRTAVLPAGWDWKAISITPEQSQHMQIMQYTRTEVAGIWTIPPHMIGDTSRLSNGNHESQALEFFTWTLRPLIVEFEGEVETKLLPTVGRNASRFSVRWDATEMIRGDFASQMTSFAVGRQWGILTTNECREPLGLNPIDGPAGEETIIPLNMVPSSRLLEEPAPDPNPSGGGDGGGGNEDQQDPAPKGNGGQNQVRLFDRMAQAYSPIFRDALGRCTAREKRDAVVVQQCFGPVLSSIAVEAVRQAQQTFRLPATVDLSTEKLLRDTAKQLEKRAASWTATTADADADRELQYCVRAIANHVFREAGSTIAQAA